MLNMIESFDNINHSSILVILLLASVHIYFNSINTIFNKHFPYWVHCSGGFAVAYIFVHLLPKLVLYANHVVLKLPDYPFLAITLVFFCMMLGFICYWLVDIQANSLVNEVGIKLHSYGFIAYNLLAGYLVTAGTSSGHVAQVLVAGAIALHLAGMNHLIVERSPALFTKALRWLFAFGVIAGALLGSLDLLPKLTLIVLTAFIGGAILINVVYYELPNNQGRSVKPFLFGVAFFSCLRIIIGYYSHLP
jgi:hypothetical protein